MPPEINTGVAHPARVYDYMLGGKDNFAADRALADAVTAAIPSAPAMARANRAFLGRAVRYLAGEAGVRQAQVAAFFTGLDLVDPGVVPVLAWRPDDGAPADPRAAYYYAAMGRKP